MINSPYQKYQQSSVQTASPSQLVLMLYDGAIRFVKLGVEAIESRNIEKANNNLIKAQKVINELAASLDFQYPIATDLARIYEYMVYRLIQANLKKAAEPANEVLSYLADLKEAWAQAAKPAAIAGHASHG